MSTLFKETTDERWYIKERKEVDGEDYIRMRVYKLTDRWRRTKDTWYRVVPEEPEYKTYKFTFYHPYREEVNTWLAIPAGESPEDYWDEAFAQMKRGCYKLEGGYGHDNFLDLFEKGGYEGIEERDGEVGAVIIYSKDKRYSYTMDHDLVRYSRGTVRKRGAQNPWKQSRL